MMLRKRHSILFLECLLGLAAVVAGDNSIVSLPFEQGSRSLQTSCADAILRTANGEFSPETTLGKTQASGLGTCNGLSSEVGPGAWFAVEGNGARIKASTCNENTEFKTTLLVYTGVVLDCSNDQLICVESSQDSDFECGVAPDKATSVEFQTINNQIYYILVQAQIPGDQGTMWMNFKSVTLPRNDECNTAIGPIPPVNLQVVSSTFFASISPMTSYCGVNQSNPGVWFSLFGTGSDMTISSCGNSDAMFAFSLYNGPSCDKLECELDAGTYSVTKTSGDQSKCLFQNPDDSLALRDLYTISFSSTAETRYYVYVAHDTALGEGVPLTGDFRFFANSIEQPPSFPPVPYPTGTPSVAPTVRPTAFGLTAFPTMAPTPIPAPIVLTTPTIIPLQKRIPIDSNGSLKSSANNTRSMLVYLLFSMGGWMLNGVW